MKTNNLILIIILGLIFTPQPIKRDVYKIYTNEIPLMIEYESLIDSEESAAGPITSFEECPGGVCPAP